MITIRLHFVDNKMLFSIIESQTIGNVRQEKTKGVFSIDAINTTDFRHKPLDVHQLTDQEIDKLNKKYKNGVFTLSIGVGSIWLLDDLMDWVNASVARQIDACL